MRAYQIGEPLGRRPEGVARGQFNSGWQCQEKLTYRDKVGNTNESGERPAHQGHEAQEIEARPRVVGMADRCAAAAPVASLVYRA